MKKVRVCMLVLAVVAGASWSANAQGTAKTESTSVRAEQNATREISGKIQSVKGTLVIIQTRTGSLVQVDAKRAVEAQRSVPLVVGRAIAVEGTIDKAGVFHAETLQRAKDSSTMWPADR